MRPVSDFRLEVSFAHVTFHRAGSLNDSMLIFMKKNERQTLTLSMYEMPTDTYLKLSHIHYFSNEVIESANQPVRGPTHSSSVPQAKAMLP